LQFGITQFQTTLFLLLELLEAAFLFLKKIYYDIFIIHEGIHSDNQITLILYISYIAPIVSPTNLLPDPLKAIARDFFVLFHIGV
jgi:hypothetical protein